MVTINEAGRKRVQSASDVPRASIVPADLVACSKNELATSSRFYRKPKQVHGEKGEQDDRSRPIKQERVPVSAINKYAVEEDGLEAQG